MTDMAIKIGNMELYTVEELAGLFQIQEATVRKLLNNGRLKGRKLAKRWYVTDKSLKDYFLAESAGDDLEELEAAEHEIEAPGSSNSSR